MTNEDVRLIKKKKTMRFSGEIYTNSEEKKRSSNVKNIGGNFRQSCKIWHFLTKMKRHSTCRELYADSLNLLEFEKC